MRTSVLLILLMTCYLNSTKKFSTTMPIYERIKMLKEMVRQNLRNPSPPDPDEPIPVYEESDENAPIMPISESNELKHNDKFKLKKIKTQPTTSNLLRADTQTTVAPRVQLNERVTAISKLLLPRISKATSSAFEIFYRKNFDHSVLNTPEPWLHCEDHITPYLRGAKKKLIRPKKLHANDYLPHRFLNLLKSNVTRMSRSEKKSLMFQMSKLKIRLYAWDQNALDLLTNAIGIKYGQGLKIDFLALKRGLMNLISQLQMDLSNRTKLLIQSRIFRPPCIVRDIYGSSKFVPGSTLPTYAVRKPDSFECVRRDQYNICI